MPLTRNTTTGFRKNWQQHLDNRREIPLSLLLAAQIITIMISPSLQDEWSLGSMLFTTMIILSMILSIGPLTVTKPRIRIILKLAGGGLIIASLLSTTFGSDTQEFYIQIGFLLFFQSAMMLMLLAHLFLQVSQKEKLLAALNFYLLTGITFSYVYLLINNLNPEAFSIETINNISNWPDYLYFSFVTLTTLGYGDILPKTHVAQSLVTIEALIGVLSPTIMIARFVSNDD